jgi:DNA-binding CsgD family transcriptional regulator
MTPAKRALELLEALYRGGHRVDAWLGFVQALSDELGGAAILVASEYPDWENSPDTYWVHLDRRLSDLFRWHLERGLPWGSTSDPAFAEHFCRTSALIPDRELAKTHFYQGWMQPQRLACEGPLLHSAPFSDRRPDWLMAIFRREGGRALGDDDQALCDLLAPHIARASQLFDSFSRLRRERVTLGQVLDRISAGIFLLDEKNGFLIGNLAARLMLEASDGLELRDGSVHLEAAESARELQRLLGQAIGWRVRGSIGVGGELAIPRPSGRPAYVGYVLPMSSASSSSAIGDEVAVLWVVDPVGDQTIAAKRIQLASGLTDTETELVRLLAEGLSLEEISRERGVTLNTTRSHLKHAFAKTLTTRQGELVRKVLSGD